MRTCSSETARHRWIWVAPIFGMLQWLKQTWIGNHSLCQATQTMVNPPVLYPLLTFQMNNWDLPGLFVHLQCRQMLPKSQELSQISGCITAMSKILKDWFCMRDIPNSFWWYGLFGAFVCDEHPADSSNMFLGQAKDSETQWIPQIWAVDLEHNIYAILGKMRGFKFESENGSWTIRKLKSYKDNKLYIEENGGDALSKLPFQCEYECNVGDDSPNPDRSDHCCIFSNVSMVCWKQNRHEFDDVSGFNSSLRRSGPSSSSNPLVVSRLRRYSIVPKPWSPRERPLPPQGVLPRDRNLHVCAWKGWKFHGKQTTTTTLILFVVVWHS